MGFVIDKSLEELAYFDYDIQGCLEGLMNSGLDINAKIEVDWQKKEYVCTINGFSFSSRSPRKAVEEASMNLLYGSKSHTRNRDRRGRPPQIPKEVDSWMKLMQWLAGDNILVPPEDGIITTAMLDNWVENFRKI